MYKLTLMAVIILVAFGCKAPIQLSNITLVEHFTQTFDFGKVPKDRRVNFVEKMLATADVSSKFGRYLNDSIGKDMAKDLFDHPGRVGTEGVVIFTLSLMPFKKKPDKFDVSGTGHYDIINYKNNEIYFTSTFYFTECIECSSGIYSLIEKMKDTTSLTLKFKQVAINQFDYIEENPLKKGTKYKHAPQIPIEVYINLKRRKEYGKYCFSINYNHKHPVYFGSKEEKTQIGTLSITPPADTSWGSRIIDLKNMNFLIRKYKKPAP